MGVSLQGLLRRLHLLPQNKQRLTVLHGCSGTLKPGRLTLLLGPPSSGKTTLLRALAGKLAGGSLQVLSLHFCKFEPCSLIVQRQDHAAQGAR